MVLVHGAWHGGWCWERVTPHLRAAGVGVSTPTLTGLAERAGELNQETGLATHIADIVSVLEAHDLRRVILVGHSYGGMVITGVMDRVPDRIKHVVFLDAAVPGDGQSLWDLLGGRGMDPKRFADGFMQVPWVKADAKPPYNVKQSIGCFNQPVSFQNPAAKALPVTYVAFVPKDKSAEERAKTDKSWQRAVSRGWTIRTFPGGHVAQQEDPRGVATLIEESISDRNKPASAQ